MWPVLQVRATRVCVSRRQLNAVITGIHNHNTQFLVTWVTLGSTRMVFSDPKNDSKCLISAWTVRATRGQST